MSAPRTRKRLIDMLRRTAGFDTQSPTAGLDDAELWEAQGRAARALEQAERLSERVAAAAAKQKPQLDSTEERLREAGGRIHTALTASARARGVIERLDVVALNASLEAARAEPINRPLALMADEVRAQAALGREALAETEGGFRAADAGLGEATSGVESAVKSSAEVASEAGQLKTTTQEATRAFADLESRLRRATGLDPETARLVSAAGEHARGLAASLSALEGPHGAEALRALGPLLAPLGKLLSILESGEGQSPPRAD